MSTSNVAIFTCEMHSSKSWLQAGEVARLLSAALRCQIHPKDSQSQAESENLETYFTRDPEQTWDNW